jgi:uncharacterized protein YfaQ (DUF2300 family)
MCAHLYTCLGRQQPSWLASGMVYSSMRAGQASVQVRSVTQECASPLCGGDASAVLVTRMLQPAGPSWARILVHCMTVQQWSLHGPSMHV